MCGYYVYCLFNSCFFFFVHFSFVYFFRNTCKSWTILFAPLSLHSFSFFFNMLSWIRPCHVSLGNFTPLSNLISLNQVCWMGLWRLRSCTFQENLFEKEKKTRKLYGGSESRVYKPHWLLLTISPWGNSCSRLMGHLNTSLARVKLPMANGSFF